MTFRTDDPGARARLARAAAYLETLPPEHFTMGQFSRNDDDPADVLASRAPPCGCITGHVPRIDPELTRSLVDARAAEGRSPHLDGARRRLPGRGRRRRPGSRRPRPAPVACSAPPGTGSTTPPPAPRAGSASRSEGAVPARISTRGTWIRPLYACQARSTS